MSEFINVATVDEIPPGDSKLVEIGFTGIALFNLDGEIYAIEDMCTHDGNILADGAVEGCIVTCSRHGAKFDIKTGECLSIYADVPTYHVRVIGDDIQVGGRK